MALSASTMCMRHKRRMFPIMVGRERGLWRQIITDANTTTATQEELP